jgi:hypothetical protein
MMQKHKHGLGLDDETETARRRILAGEFPEYIVKQFSDMLDYFGQSPIIVRSSSLLEDNFGNAFAGKYESVFCANQGGPHKRLEDFLCAVRTVYASTMGEEALAYRAQRGLLGHDEQMALLIQRVSGATYGSLFFPQAAGVGFSFNPYVWHETIDPNAGVVRLVFGVGTRAVERADDDYTRIVALNAPERRPHASSDEVRHYAQRRVDVLDLEGNQLASMEFEEIIARNPHLPLEMFASRDRAMERALGHARAGTASWVLTLDRLVSGTRFVADMRAMLASLQEAYQYPVDVEFTLNFFDKDEYRINLVQCRPLQVSGEFDIADPPEHIPEGDLVLETRGAVIGKSVWLTLDWIVYVVPHVYAELPIADRYAVARVIGDVFHHEAVQGRATMLIGPGRWGTSTPALGVPVSFAEINSASVLCELVTMRDTLVPDVSLGTHFFNEMVENDILYLALFPNREGNALNAQYLEESQRNVISKLTPAHAGWAETVRVLSVSEDATGPAVRLHADALRQHVVCYLEHSPEPDREG